ncbi:MAG: hypothetical protein M1524_01060 [Patescibacteria group bacterium]|nr:hypothetical protein [Patescibacteria group bacterium]
MVERLSSAERRKQLEAAYSSEIADIRVWATDFGNKLWHESDWRVRDLIEHDNRRFRIAHRLGISLDERLNRYREQDEKYPSHPNTQRQIVKAVMGIDEDIADYQAEIEFEIAKGEVVVYDPWAEERYSQLTRRRTKLVARLTSQRARKLGVPSI